MTKAEGMSVGAVGRIDVVRCEPAEYAQAAQESRKATGYHQADWLEGLRDTWPRLEIGYHRLERDGQCLGHLPVMSLDRLGLRLCGSPLRGFFTPYLGPVLRGEAGVPPGLQGAVEQSLRPDLFDFSLPPGPVPEAGARLCPTAIVDLAGEEPVLWKNVEKKARTQVRQAVAKGVRVFSPEGVGPWLSEYHRIGTANYARQGLPNPAPRAFFENLCRRFLGTDRLKVLLAEVEGRLVAGSFYLLWRDTVYGIDGVADREAGACRAGTLVEWETIRWAREAGFARYDMVGASVEGIARFKRSLGAQIVAHVSESRPASSRVRLAMRAYYSLPRSLRAWLNPKGATP
jgi:hypothetical protein